MKLRWYCLVMLVLFPVLAYPQEHKKGDLEENKHHEPSKQIFTTGELLPVKGIVLESDNKGNFLPLQGASIYWLGTTKGTLSDSAGIFYLLPDPSTDKLVVSFTGYTSDTLTIEELKELKIILASDKHLEEVIVHSKLHSTYISSLSPFRIQVMTELELLKAACCNLTESFETNPSVDVSYTDALTGSRQIQLLGLSSNYTQITFENLPASRGLTIPLGLNGLAGSWIESIQLAKGIGSVVNGFESVAGQINVEFKKAGNSDKVFVNAFIDDRGKTDLNVNVNLKAGKKWNTIFLLHDDFFTDKKLDHNKDGFRDQPYGSQFSFSNRWKYDDAKGLVVQFGASIFNNHRTGGEITFNPSIEKDDLKHYGLGIKIDRYEAFGKVGYVFPNKQYKSIGFQFSGFKHHHHSYFGLRHYNGHQDNFYGNFIYQSIIKNTKHKFRTGLSLLYDDYDENVDAEEFNRKEIVPGAFFEYTWSPVKNFDAVLGIRGDHNNLFGFFSTPRVHVRYEPFHGTVLRFSAGRGQRTANIFSENINLFTSSREFVLQKTNRHGYGFNPEKACSYGFSVDQHFKLFKRESSFSVDYFRTDFIDQVVVDVENPREVKFYNLEGRSFSNSLQAQWIVEPVKHLEMRLAYRLLDVKSNFGHEFLSRPLLSPHRAFLNLEYHVGTWKFDYTFNYNSSKRIPSTQANPVEYRFEEHSPGYLLMNVHITKTIGRKRPIDVYVGGENIGNFVQEELIIASHNPFSPYFDGSLVWGPAEERLIYAGVRFRLK